MRPYYKDTKPQGRFESPVTIGIMICWISFLILHYGSFPIERYVGISTDPTVPTAFITYSLVSLDIIQTLFAALALYFTGKSLEDAWGSKKFIIFLIIISLFGAVFYEAGAMFFGYGIQPLANPWKLVSGVIVAWAFMYPHERINFWMIPIPSKIMALITVLLEYFMNAPQAEIRNLQIIAGLFALGSVLSAWLFVNYQYLFQQQTKKSNSKSKPNFFIRIFREIERRHRIAQLKRKFRFNDEDDK